LNAGADLRAELRGAAQLRRDTALGKHIAAARLIVSLLVSCEAQELRKSPGNFRTVENFVRDAEFAGDLDRARDEVRLAMVRGRSRAGPHDQNTAIVQQLLAGIRFKLAPDPVGVEDEWSVDTTLTDRLPRDTGFSVARPHAVWRRETIYADRMHAAL